MSEHSAIDEKRMYVTEQQAVGVDDIYSDSDLILDLGGGGEGIIGQLRGRQVVAVDMRKRELEECAPGPIKIVANAKDLPFLDQAFDAVTAFFFFMYVAESERESILAEAYRVLRPGGQFVIWDAHIPSRGDRPQEIYVVSVKAELPDRMIETGYGTRWDGHEMSLNSMAQKAQEAGFSIKEKATEGGHFHLTLARNL